MPADLALRLQNGGFDFNRNFFEVPARPRQTDALSSDVEKFRIDFF